MPTRFNRAELREGLILHTRTPRFVGRSIRRVLQRGYPAGVVWGNHDALIVGAHDSALLGVGESVPWRARVTSLEWYEEAMERGEVECRVYAVTGATRDQECGASDYYLEHVVGTWYDFAALPRLAIKSLLMDVWRKAAGWEWAWYCTEGVQTAYQAVGLTPWGKRNATPLTTEKRVSATLEDVTAAMLI